MPLDTEIKNVNENIIDINLESAKKTRIRINGDPNSTLELNLSDLGIADRLDKGYIKLQQCMRNISNADIDESNLSEILKSADEEMKETIDYIFDAPVSEVCCKNGTMYDMKDGECRFENILNALTKLYSDNLNAEYKAMKRRIKQNADLYLQDHKPKQIKKKVVQKTDE